MTTVETPRLIVSPITANSALAAGKHTPVDATAGPITVTLPSPVTPGAHLSVEKSDASSNTVTVSGTIRGTATTTVLTLKGSSVTFVAENSGISWTPTAGRVPEATLTAGFLKLGGTTISGTRSGPYVEFDNESDEASLHFVAIPGFTGPYLIGVGVNTDNSTGLVVDVTNPGAQGIQANLLTGANSTSIAFNAQINAGITGGVALSGSSYGATGLIEKLHASGVPATGQKMVVWQTDALAGTSGFGADILNVYADTGLFDAVSPTFRKNGGMLVVQDEDFPGANNVNLQRQHGLYHDLYAFSGSAGQYWGGRIAGTAPGGVVLSASTGPVGIGSETWVEGLRVQDVSGAAGLAFFGATAVNRYTGTPAAATDLASALTLINALRADLLGYGLIA